MILFLTGYRGSGKSTVASLLCERFCCELVDTDRRIEQSSGKTIREIFATEGESAFRQLETQTIKLLVDEFDQGEALKRVSLVVSLGGGAIVTAENRELISAGKTIYLKASPEILWERISADQHSTETRPDLTDSGGLAEVRAVLAARNDTYAGCADYSIDTDELSPEQAADAVAGWLESDDKKKVRPET